MNLGDLHHVTNSSGIRKTLSLPFQFLTVLFAGSSWLHRGGSGSTEAHRAVGTMWLCRPSAASHHKPAHRPGCWGFHNNGKSLSPAFSVEATKRIPIHTKSLSVKGNYRMPKNDNADFILSYTVRATLRLKLQFMLLLPAVKIDLKISIFTI